MGIDNTTFCKVIDQSAGHLDDHLVDPKAAAFVVDPKVAFVVDPKDSFALDPKIAFELATLAATTVLVLAITP